jgi:hypothetical protein
VETPVVAGEKQSGEEESVLKPLHEWMSTFEGLWKQVVAGKRKSREDEPVLKRSGVLQMR